MEYTTLGRTGMEVSRVGLGCVGFGSPKWRDWVLEEDESLEILETAVESGINYFDTANIYSRGESERIVGKALEGRREDCVVATKTYFRMREGKPLSGGLSRKAIEQELEGSLSRLGMDTVDIFQLHRWDYDTPIEETLRALDDVITRGKTRYAGATAMWTHEFARAYYHSRLEGLEQPATMQSHYNLVYREEEREMLPFCQQHDIGVLTWSSLARGYLTRSHENLKATERGKYEQGIHAYPYIERGGKEINARVQELADEKDVSMAQISMAWLLHQDPVDVVLFGATRPEHIEDTVEAVDLSLSDDDLAYLEEPYEAVAPIDYKLPKTF